MANYQSRLPLPDLDTLFQALRAYASAEIVETPQGFEAVVTFLDDNPLDVGISWANTSDEIRSLLGGPGLERPTREVPDEAGV